MKPSERIKEIRQEYDDSESHPVACYVNAIIQYLDEQDTHKCQCKK